MKIAVRPSILGLCAALIIVGALLIIFASFIILPPNDRDNLNPAKKIEMINLSLRWGRLATFPSSSQDFSIRTEGGAFTRTFRGSFSDSPESISQWLHNSKGISEGRSEIQPDKSTKYILKTGEGASYGEVIVSPDSSHVSFEVSWS